MRGGEAELARRMGVRHGTLIGKLNPHDEGHLPNLGEFVRILDATGGLEPLEILCAMFGGRFVTRSDECGESLLHATLRAVSEGGDVVNTVDAEVSICVPLRPVS